MKKIVKRAIITVLILTILIFAVVIWCDLHGHHSYTLEILDRLYVTKIERAAKDVRKYGIKNDLFEKESDEKSAFYQETEDDFIDHSEMINAYTYMVFDGVEYLSRQSQCRGVDTDILLGEYTIVDNAVFVDEPSEIPEIICRVFKISGIPETCMVAVEMEENNESFYVVFHNAEYIAEDIGQLLNDTGLLSDGVVEEVYILPDGYYDRSTMIWFYDDVEQEVLDFLTAISEKDMEEVSPMHSSNTVAKIYIRNTKSEQHYEFSLEDNGIICENHKNCHSYGDDFEDLMIEFLKSLKGKRGWTQG